MITFDGEKTILNEKSYIFASLAIRYLILLETTAKTLVFWK